MKVLTVALVAVVSAHPVLGCDLCSVYAANEGGVPDGDSAETLVYVGPQIIFYVGK